MIPPSFVVAVTVFAAPWRDPCVGVAPACRIAAQDAILVWRTRSATTADALEACQTKLAARSPEVIREMVDVPMPEPTGPGWGAILGVGGGSLVVGALVGLLLGLRH